MATSRSASCRCIDLTGSKYTGTVTPTMSEHMRYDDFRELWRCCVDRSRLLHTLGGPTETIDVEWMSREYAIRIMGIHQVEPYTISAKVRWRWDAVQAARTRTTEEDLLTTILGDADDVETARPWLRVDIEIAASAHLDAKLQL